MPKHHAQRLTGRVRTLKPTHFGCTYGMCFITAFAVDYALLLSETKETHSLVDGCPMPLR